MQYNLASNNPFLTIDEISNITCKSVKFIRREVASGRLKSIKKGNKTLINK